MAAGLRLRRPRTRPRKISTAAHPRARDRTSRPCIRLRPAGMAIALAAALGAGGAMDEDTAYVEAVGSLRALSSLQYLGLPVPLDRLGAALRYQTDHDEAGRATSCGPRTSRLMVKVLAEESARLGVPVLNRCVGATILTPPDGPRRVVGLLAFHVADRAAANPLGLAVIRCSDLVIAAGGPGELYRDSVYPKHCFGALGLALEAGVEAINLTESQFGIGTPRDGSPWNLSGTYAQCLPYIHSVDTDGIGAQFPGRLLSNDTMAVPCLTNARLRFQPCRVDRATYS